MIGDTGGLEQVIVNLVVNARDAMVAGGRLSVTTCNVKVTEREGNGLGVRPGDYVMLCVSDTGTGMSPETQAHIFEPFFTTKEAGQGTGLGLATVHGIVRQLGGAIAVDSELGKGSTFRVYFPRAGETGRESPAPALATRAATGTERVLVVEDEPGLRALICRVLRAAGYRVTDASRPSVAITLAENEAFDVLITDIVLPEFNGRELVTRLRAHTPQLKVLYLSGYPGGALTAQQLAHDGLPFMAKPFTPEVLLTKVREALDVPSTHPPTS
jgi:CheY-like chemotaxis protein